MPSAFGHAAVGLALAPVVLGPGAPRRLLVLGVVCAVVPGPRRLRRPAPRLHALAVRRRASRGCARLARATARLALLAPARVRVPVRCRRIARPARHLHRRRRRRGAPRAVRRDRYPRRSGRSPCRRWACSGSSPRAGSRFSRASSSGSAFPAHCWSPQAVWRGGRSREDCGEREGNDPDRGGEGASAAPRARCGAAAPEARRTTSTSGSCSPRGTRSRTTSSC